MIAETTRGGNLAWSPDGTMLAFEDVGGIYVVSSDGTGESRLSTGPGTDQSPAWSPDGTKIAVRTLEDMDGGIPVVNVDGSGRRQLTNDVMDGWPAWSPDGGLIAFRHNSTVSVLDVDGGRARQLASPGGTGRVDPSGQGANKLAVGGGDPSSPRWSPDGTKLVYALWQSAESCSIWVMSADGGEQGRLTDGQTCDRDPAWQPLPA